MKSLWSFCIVVIISLTMPCFACEISTPEVDVQVTVDNSPCAGETVYFDASGSFCADPGTLEFTWTFPPQAYYVHIDGDSAYCKFSPAGSYDVNLEVKNLSTDQSGFWQNALDRTAACDDDTMTVSDCVSIWYVSAIDGDNDDNGQSWTNAFRTIQIAIDSASDGDEICVDSGDGTAPTVYYEQLDMKGKSLDIHSADPDGILTEWQRSENTILDAQKQGSAIVYRGNETNSTGPNLEGFTITGGYPAGDGLALHLTMDDGSGMTATDASGKQRDGTLVNDPNWITDGYLSGALEFDGSDDYVKIEGYKGVSGTHGRTVSAWIRTSNHDGGGTIVQWGTDDYENYWLLRTTPSWKDNSTNPGQLDDTIMISNWGFEVYSTTKVVDGSWHHVAVVLEEGESDIRNIKLYIDGRLDSTILGNYTQYEIDTRLSVPVHIGAAKRYVNNDMVGYYDGSIDDVCIYSRALSDDEIGEMAGVPVPIVCLPFDNDANDISGNDYHGTEYGNPNYSDNVLNLDGTDDFVEISHDDGLSSFVSLTMSAWVFPVSGIANYDIIVNKESEYEMAWKDNQLVSAINTDTNNWFWTQGTGANTLPTGQWTHVAVAWDGSNIYEFINGVLKKTTAQAGNNTSFTTNPLRIGRRGSGAYWNGKLSDVQIFGSALSAEEVAELAGVESPVAHWKLDGDPNDFSGNGFDGTFYGNPNWTDGYFDQALELDGVDDYIACGSSWNISDFGGVNGQVTIAAWVNPRVINEYNVVTRHFGGVHYLSAGTTSGGYLRTMVRDVVNDVNYWPTSTGTISANEWSHVVFILEGGVGYKFFINGVLDRQVTNTNLGLYQYSPTGYLGVGTSSSAYFDGSFDDVRVYNRVLTATEIHELADKTPKLLAHWKLDGDCTDAAGNGHHGTEPNNVAYSAGMAGDAISLDGTGQYVSIPHDPKLKPQLPLSLSAWINVPESGSNPTIISTDDAVGKYSGVRLRLAYDRSDNVVIEYGDGTGTGPDRRATKQGTTSLQPGRWYHIVGVMRGPQDMSIYINGVDDGGEYTGTSTRPIYYEGNDSVIGCNMDVLDDFNGSIDDVRIYNYDLSVAEVKSLYQSRFTDGGGIKGHGASVDISVCNINDNKTATNGGGLEYCYGSIQNSLVTNNIATGVGGGMTGCGDIINCTAVNNSASQAGGLYDCNDLILNSILWSNGSSPLVDCAVPSYSDIEDWAGGGTGNLSVDPNFIDVLNGNYHLDPNTSLCIDAGNPYSEYSNEPQPNGGRINMGAYGNTSEAAITVDSDGDGLGDAVERRLGLDPQDADSDDDGLTDQEEIQIYGTDALDADTDNDGMTDGWEVDNGGYPTYAGDAGMDYDGDGLTNLQEFLAGTNPHSADSDNDGMPDAWESQNSLDPTNSDDADTDLDSDTYSNVIEYWHNGDPNDPNSLDPRKFIVPTDVDTIQQAIDWSIDGDEIEVLPGTYYEQINFSGKAITVRSSNPNNWDTVEATVIDANDITTGIVVTFNSLEDANSILSGLTITGGYYGIKIHNSYLDPHTPVIEKCVVRDNEMYGIYSIYADPIIRGNRLRDNDGFGAVFGCYADHILISNNLFDGNYRAITLRYGSSGEVSNNTLVGNYHAILSFENSSPVITNCIVWDTGCYVLYDCTATYSCIEDWTGGGTGNISSNPNFVDAANGDYHLSVNSPCLNTGDPNGVYDGQVDIDGDPRVRGLRVDMGADEAPVIWHVDNDANGLSTGFTWTDAFTSIQDAMDAASDNDTVLVAEGTYNENLRFPDKSITVTGTATEDWSTVESTIIAAEDPNLPCVLFNTNPETPSTLAGFTIQGGYEGIMIYSQASPEIHHCQITQNEVGISCAWGDPNIIDCRIISNTGTGIDVGFGDPTVKNSIIAKNQNGGVAGPILIENCTIADNSAYGVIACEETVLNSIVWNNDSNSLLGVFAEYSCVQYDNMLGSNISYFPYFADANDYTLMDYSPCIDAGEPNGLYVNEPNDGGFCINMGAYGNTASATLASPDADSDGLPDTWEALYWSTSDPNDADDDYDTDYLSNLAEYHAGTNPTSSDTDGDNVPDFWELLCGLDPRDSTDGNQDQDGDGLTDYQEYQNLTNPLSTDTDGDGLPDAWEVQYQLNPLADDASQDPDNDGLTNLQEYQLGSDPKDSDTDNDGMSDGWEVENGLDLLSNADASLDADGDGLTNLQEFQAGTGMNQVDTDGDGLSDAWEENNGLDPLDAADKETDLDNDGYSNWVEYLHNGDPNDNDPNQTFENITITVPTLADTIQQGVDLSIDGDTVLVMPGFYQENIVIDGKAITLTGSETTDWQEICETTIYADEYDSIIAIQGNNANCVIRYFRFVGSKQAINLTGNGAPVFEWLIIEDTLQAAINCEAGTPTIRNCMIGLNNDDGVKLSGVANAVIKNNWIYNNEGDGLEIVTNANNCLIRNNTIVNNAMNEIKYSGDTNYMPQITNCILWHPGDSDDDLSGCVASYSCISDSVGDTNISSDPQFIDADNYNYSINYLSPCVNVGDPNGVNADEKDITNQTRMAGRVDIGADEVCAIYNETQDLWYQASIQEAIDQAHVNDVILLYDWVYSENIDPNGKSVVITGLDPYNEGVVNSTVLCADDPNLPVITFSSGEDANSLVTGITIQGQDNAAGVLITNQSSPVITRCTIEYNSDGIYCDSGSPLIAQNRIKNNRTLSGSGIIVTDAATPVIRANLIYDNDNGIKYTDTQSVSQAYNNTIAFNGNVDPNQTADTYGVYVEPNAITPTIVNTIFWDNEDDIENCTATYSCFTDANDIGDPNLTNNVAMNPNFTNPTKDIFFISSESPVFEGGTQQEGTSLQGLPLENTIGAASGRVLYVTGAGFEGGWKTDPEIDQNLVFDYLKPAIAASVDGDEIWIREGVYTPVQPVASNEDPRADIFNIPHTLYIYGGFSGVESEKSERDSKNYKTVLSGDLLGNDRDYDPGSEWYYDPSFDDNSDLVIRGALADPGEINDLVLDSLSVSGSGGPYAVYRGARMKYSPLLESMYYCINKDRLANTLRSVGFNITISNCTFSNNRNNSDGIYVHGDLYCIENYSCQLRNSTFSKSGTMRLLDIIANIDNCVFANNYGLAAVCIGMDDTTSPSSNYNGSVVNCTFYGNFSPCWGGALYVETKFPFEISNNIFWNNLSEEDLLEVYLRCRNEVTISNCCFEEGIDGGKIAVSPSSDNFIDGGGNIPDNPNFVNTNNPIGLDGIWGTRDDGLRLGDGSPCLDKGSNSAASGILTDITGNGRKRDDDDVSGDRVDIGAYEGARPVAMAINEITTQNKTLTFGLDASYVEFGDLLDCMLVCQPEHGEATLSWTEEDGFTFEYTPEELFYSDAEDGEDMTYDIFAYCVSDGMWSKPGEIKIDVQKDADGDGLSDKDERNGIEVPPNSGIIFTSNPNIWDTDEDGYPDGWEVKKGHNPDDNADHPLDTEDTDGDGLTDKIEFELGTDPEDDGDFDDDGMQDVWEYAYGLDPTINSDDHGADGDPDKDDMTNLAEYEFSIARTENLLNNLNPTLNPPNSLNPRKRDTDGDEMHDGWEVKYSSEKEYSWEADCILNPLDPDDADDNLDAWDDSHVLERDLLTNLDEFINGTNPRRWDTDMDGVGDSEELLGSGFVYPPSYSDAHYRHVFKTSPINPDTDGDGLIDMTCGFYLEKQYDDDDTEASYLKESIHCNYPYHQNLIVCLETDNGDFCDCGMNLHYGYIGDSNPLLSDSDLSWKFKISSNPDRWKVVHGPDGLPDGWEVIYGEIGREYDKFDPRCPYYVRDDHNTNTLNEDWDSDGLKNIDEYKYGCSPIQRDEHAHHCYVWQWKYNGDKSPFAEKSWDTDNDRLADGLEVHGITINGVTYTSDPTSSDTDGDGLDDWDELYTYGTPLNPSSFDTDGDGFSDAWELEYDDFDPWLPNLINQYNANSVRDTDQMVAIPSISGKFNQAVGFDGVSNYIEVPDNESLNFGEEDFSISFWIRFEFGSEPTGRQYVIGKRSSSKGYAVFVDKDGTMGAVIQASSTREVVVTGARPSSLGVVTDGNWYHVAVRRDCRSDEDVLKVIVNYSRLNEEVDRYTSPLSIENDSSLLLGMGDGADDGILTQPFSGQLDNIIIFDSYLSDNDIWWLHDTGSENETRGYAPIAHWKMNGFEEVDSGDSILKDSGGSSLHGLPRNFPSFEGFLNGAYLFNGDNDCLTANLYNGVAETEYLTLSKASWGGWFKFQTADQSEEGLIIGRNLADETAFALTRMGLAHDGSLDNKFRAYIGNAWIESTWIPDSEINSGWHFVMAVYDGASDLLIYLDGNLVGNGTVSNVDEMYVNTFQIGGNNTLGFNYFRGGVDEVLLYADALNKEAVQSLYEMYTSGPQDEVVLEAQSRAVMAEMLVAVMEQATTEDNTEQDPSEDKLAARYSCDLESQSDVVPDESLKHSKLDSDGDGVTDYEEKIYGMDPHSKDTDGDGLEDEFELIQFKADGRYNPNSDNEKMVASLKMKIGDPSGSHSEQYVMTCSGDNLKENLYFVSNMGRVSYSRDFPVEAGHSYELNLGWVQSKDSKYEPDYDYVAEVSARREYFRYDKVDPRNFGYWIEDKDKVLAEYEDPPHEFYPRGKKKPMIHIAYANIIGTIDEYTIREKYQYYHVRKDELKLTDPVEKIKLFQDMTSTTLELVAAPEVPGALVTLAYGEGFTIYANGEILDKTTTWEVKDLPERITIGLEPTNQIKVGILLTYHKPGEDGGKGDVVAYDSVSVFPGPYTLKKQLEYLDSLYKAVDGDPVTLEDGAYTLDAVDLQIKGRKLDYSIRRHYRSTSGMNEYLGHGWDMNCNMRLLRGYDVMDNLSYVLLFNGQGGREKYDVSNVVGQENQFYHPAKPGQYFQYNPEPESDTFTLVKKNGTEYAFNQQDYLDTISDRHGNQIRFEYIMMDPKFLLLHKIIDDLERETIFEYDFDTLLLKSITDFAGRTWSYQYEDYNLISVTTPAPDDSSVGLTTSYVYDDKHRMIEVYDPANDPAPEAGGTPYVVNTYKYGKVDTQIYGENGETEKQEFIFDYDPGLQRVDVTDRNGNVTTTYYNEYGDTQAEVVSNADGTEYYITEYEYDGNRQLKKVTLPRGNAVEYQYDTNGNVIEVTQIPAPDGQVADTGEGIPMRAYQLITMGTYQYERVPEKHNFVIKEATDSLGNTTTYAYDYELPEEDPLHGQKGNLMKITYPAVDVYEHSSQQSPEIKFEYNDYGQIKKMIAPDDIEVAFDYYGQDDFDSSIAGLVGFWRMDDNNPSASVYEISGLGNHGTLQSKEEGAWGNVFTESRSVSGQSASSLGLNGNDRILVEHKSELDITGAVTVACWVYVDDMTKTQYLVSKRAANNNSYSLFLYYNSGSETLHPVLSRGDGQNEDTLMDSTIDYITAGRWYHIAGTIDDNKYARLYLDGNLIKEEQFTRTAGGTTNDLLIGSQPSHDHPVYGRMDNVMIFDRSLSQEELLLLKGYQTGRLARVTVDPEIEQAESDSLVGFWRMDDSAGGILADVYDYSGRNHHGTSSRLMTAVDGQIDKALPFDATNSDCVEVPYSPDFDIDGELTISAWVKVDTKEQHHTIVSRRSSLNDYYSLFLKYDSSKLKLYPAITRANGVNRDTVEATQVDMAAGQWYHIAATIDSDNFATLYLDGNKVDGDTLDYPAVGVPGSLFIGKLPGGWFMDGSIDHLMIFNEALTPKQVEGLVQGNQNIMVDFGYDQFGNITSSMDPEGRLSQMYYNDLELLVKSVSAMNTVNEYDYNENKKLEEVRSQYGELDANGNLISYQMVEYSYNILDKLKTVTDPMGYTTELDYDKNDNVDKVTDPEGAAATPKNYFTQTIYNERNLPWKVIDAEQVNETNPKYTEYEYDANGNLLTVTDAKQQTTTYEYDGFDRLVKTTYADDSTEEYEYDNAGHIIWHKTRAGDTFTYTYDALGRMTSKQLNDRLGEELVQDGDFDTTGDWVYEGTWFHHGGLQMATINGELNGIARLYQSLNITTGHYYEITYTVSISGSGKLSLYLADDEMYELQSGTHTIIVQAGIYGDDLAFWPYNLSGPEDVIWVDNVSVKEIVNPPIVYEYDIAGRVREVHNDADSVADLAMSYDRIGRLNVAIDENSKNVSYEYHADGSVKSVTYPNTMKVYYAYDALGRLEYVHMAEWDRESANPTPQILAHYIYDELSRRMTVEYNYDYDSTTDSKQRSDDPDYDGKMSYTYTKSERSDLNPAVDNELGHWLRSIDSDIDGDNNPDLSYAYDYDKVGNRTEVGDNVGSYVYDYSNTYQLTSANYPDNLSFADIASIVYDKVYNRDTMDGTNYTANELNQYTAVGPTGSEVTHEYDANGNLKNDGIYKYTYDAENRLVDIKTVSDADVAAYTYDSFGRRNLKYVESTGITTTYAYDGGQVIAEYEGGTIARTFIYGPGIDEPVAMKVLTGTKQGVYFYHYDGLGSVVALSKYDNTLGYAEIVEGYTYDAFGKVAIHKDAGSDGIWLNGDVGTSYWISGSGYGNPYMFTGRRLDAETRKVNEGREGLYYYRARIYNPQLGRFMQTDPIGYYDSMNLYQYCGNNPTNYIDPWGLKTYLIFEGRDHEGGSGFGHAAKYQKKRIKKGDDGYEEGDEVFIIEAHTTEDIRKALETYTDIKEIVYVGHGSRKALYIDPDGMGVYFNITGPGGNLGGEISNSKAVSDFSRENVREDAIIRLYSCNTCSYKKNIGKDLANYFDAPVYGPGTKTNFDEKTGKPFIRRARIPGLYGYHWQQPD